MNIHGSTSINIKAFGASSRRVLFSIVVCLVFLLSGGCANNTNTSKAVATVDRNNPESVLRAYFDAWGQSDWSTQMSLMDEKYAPMAPEPVDSIRILKIQPISSPASTERTYRVIFEIKVKGQGVSMHSGQYDWSYFLTWDAKHGSWLITNYGAG